MKTSQNKNIPELTLSEFDQAWDSLAAEGPISQVTYHEMSDHPVVEMDAMARLENNVATLVDLQTRFSFSMREIRYLLKVTP